MYLITPNNARIWTDSNRDFTLREYGRLEYRTPDVAWIAASARRGGRSRRRRTRGPSLTLGRRLVYFLNSFRGFAAFDVHGHGDTKCH